MIVSVYGFCFSILTRRENYRCGLTFSQSRSDHQECHSTSHLESQESKLLYQKKTRKFPRSLFYQVNENEKWGHVERDSKRKMHEKFGTALGLSVTSLPIFCFAPFSFLLLLFFLFPFILPVADIPGSLYFSSLTSMKSFRSRPVN